MVIRFIIVTLIIWTIINLIHYWISSKSPSKIDRWRDKYGISFHYFTIIFEFRSFTGWINAYRFRKHSKQLFVLNCFLHASIFICYLLFPIALIWVTVSLIRTSEIQQLIQRFISFPSGSDQPNVPTTDDRKIDENFLILIPGLTIPLGECFLFIVAIFLNSFLHELSHAFAANRHNVPIENFGIQIYFCLPMTFVTLSQGRYRRHNLIGQMEIACAGIMSNIIIAIAAFICFIWNPLSCLYMPINNNHLIITSIDNNILNGVKEFDIIVKVNNKSIKGYHDWHQTLEEIAQRQSGFCWTHENADNQITSLCNIGHCCEGKDDNRYICFLLQKTVKKIPNSSCETFKNDDFLDSNINHLLDNHLGWKFYQSYRKTCLAAKLIVENTRKFCRKNSECSIGNQHSNYCVFPYSSHKQVRLISIQIESKPELILFWGPVKELQQIIKLSDVRPRFSFIPWRLMNDFRNFFKYLFFSSFTMVIFNLFPYEPLDGYQMLTLGGLYLIGDHCLDRNHLFSKTLSALHYLSAIVFGLSMIVGLIKSENFLI